MGDPANEYVIHNEGRLLCEGRWKDVFAEGVRAKYLQTAKEEDFVPLTFDPLLQLVAKKPNANRSAINDCLCAASPAHAPMPSKEAFFHAVLLDLPGIKFVGHTHPTYVAGIMGVAEGGGVCDGAALSGSRCSCAGRGRSLCRTWIRGWPLAVELRYRLETYMNQYGDPPSTILLGNHGMISAGGDGATAVLASTAMTQKAARAYMTAQSCGGGVGVAG